MECTGGTELFPNTVYITMSDTEYENSEFNTTNVFNGDPILPDGEFLTLNLQGLLDHRNTQIILKRKVCFPMKGFWSTVSAADVTVDATRLFRKSYKSYWW